MAVEFLSDQQAAQYAAFNGAPSRAELERYFFLDDSDLEKVQAKRRAHNRLGFAVQLTSVRYLGRFMPDPRQVPAEVAEYLAEQLGIADASCLKEYGERDGTARTHAGEIQEAGGWRDFAEVRDELSEWLDARAWTTGDGPKSLFDAAGGWLRERRVLLPGASRLARLVGTVREAANSRLWDTLYGLLSTGQRAVLDSLLSVPPGARVSELDRLRRGPVRISGPQMKWALQRAEEITAFGMGEVDVSAIPPRRLAELSRYGIDGKASLLRRHSDSRRLATLLATAVYLTSRAVDDALDLLEVLIATKLLASVYARPNPKYFGRRGGATWLNMINDQAAGLGGKVVAGTPRDSLYVLDVLYDRDGGKRPEMIVTDTASYSDIVFGLLTLAGFAYAPQLADLPDQKMWRIDRTADYGAFQDAARGRIDLARIERHWEDILRIIGSIHTGAVRAYDVIRMLSRDGRPTPLGDAIAHYGRISKTLHILRLADEPGYRRQIKSQANLQEGRHALARKIFHGRQGQLYQRYQDGMEDQIGALGLALNALVLFTTRYMDAAVNQLRADGFDVRDEDVARLSPFVRHHINMLGRYSFQLPDLPGGLRPLRAPDAVDE